MNAIFLLLGIASNAAASVMIKYATLTPGSMPSLARPFVVFSNVPLLLGAGLYGIAFLLYAFALSRMPLNLVHPVLTSGAIAIVAVLSRLLFNEPLPMTTIAGIALVIVGVGLITLRVSGAE